MNLHKIKQNKSHKIIVKETMEINQINRKKSEKSF